MFQTLLNLSGEFPLIQDHSFLGRFVAILVVRGEGAWRSRVCWSSGLSRPASFLAQTSCARNTLKT